MGLFDKLFPKKKDAHDHDGHDHHGHNHGHHAHIHDDAHVKAGTPSAKHDPVCNMWVDPAKAAGKSEHGGQTYHFCSAGCKKKFDAAPHKYLGAHSH